MGAEGRSRLRGRVASSSGFCPLSPAREARTGRAASGQRIIVERGIREGSAKVRSLLAGVGYSSECFAKWRIQKYSVPISIKVGSLFA